MWEVTNFLCTDHTRLEKWKSSVLWCQSNDLICPDWLCYVWRRKEKWLHLGFTPKPLTARSKKQKEVKAQRLNILHDSWIPTPLIYIQNSSLITTDELKPQWHKEIHSQNQCQMITTLTMVGHSNDNTKANCQLQHNLIYVRIWITKGLKENESRVVCCLLF